MLMTGLIGANPTTPFSSMTFGSALLLSLILALGGAGAALLFAGLRHLLRRLLIAKSPAREAPRAETTPPAPTPPPGADEDDAPTCPGVKPAFVAEIVPRAPSGSFALASHHEPNSWINEYIDRLRQVLPGIEDEAPETPFVLSPRGSTPGPTSADATVQVDTTVLLDMMAEVAPAAPEVIAVREVLEVRQLREIRGIPSMPLAQALGRVSPDRTVRLPALPPANNHPPEHETLIMGSIEELAELEAQPADSRRRMPSSSGVVPAAGSTTLLLESSTFQYGARRG